MTPPIRPDDTGDWLEQYFTKHQIAPVQPDGSAVRRPQLPVDRTIGPASPVKSAPVAGGILGMLYGAGEQVHNALAKRAKGYGATDAAKDVADASGIGDIARGISNKDFGSLAAGVAALAMPGEGKAAKTAFREVEPELFHGALSQFAKKRPSEAGFITWRTPEEMRAENMRTFLSPDKKTGYAVHPESGDIRNVFNHGRKGAGAHAVAHALGNGGKVLDAFDTNLGNFYRDMGFKETWRSPWNDEYRPTNWDPKYGTPDVIGMEHPQAGKASPEELLAQYEARRADRKGVAAPMFNLSEPWKPTSRGVFDRNAPAIQGRMESDPRLVPPPPKTDRMTMSPLVDAILNSKTVKKGLDANVDKGMLQGGPTWYELGPIKQFIDEYGGPTSFDEFNAMGGGASASNSVANELSAFSVMNYARLHGLDREEAVRHYLKAVGGNKPPLMDMHMDLGLGGVKEGGTVLPSNPMSEAWKIPSYVDKRRGGGGTRDVTQPGGMPALDTHERRKLMQLAMANRALRSLAKETGAADAAAKSKGALPLRNVLDYQGISSLYTDGAKRYSLPTAGAYQAPRWLGGWKETGLKSPPQGDFVQIVEDALKFSAQAQRLDDSPAGLRDLFKGVLHGDGRFIVPWFKEGPYPIK